MYQVKDLTKLTVKDLWLEVKSEEEWWGEISERALGMVKLHLITESGRRTTGVFAGLPLRPY